ncbi:plasmid replication protein RepC [Tateyamaria sp. Alg231-49]|uniref:plasmid replication protein RepC n=1 Tax=Tateyamaria sp. Alg231-49 TaxID=1922219 RepID=UPI000D554108|nr:plasmid replication protein RepC [Tateyamaria sp. Alg231-49]
MITHAQRNVGQAGASASAGPACIDKWSLIEALTHAAESFGIGHRQLGVLRTLITFHPQRFWPVTADRLIVYPSNRTLCDRLGGMPDSTLRRHLRALVSAGLITRSASSNGKRYRRGKGANEIAFGIDLAPLIRLTAKIRQAAQTAQDQAEALAAQRARLLALLKELKAQDAAPHTSFLADLARAMRRKLGLNEILDLIGQAIARLSAVLKKASSTMEMNASDSQNERHKEQQERKKTDGAEDITLHEINALCREKATLFPDPMHQWTDVTRTAAIVAPMIGIAESAFENARRSIGSVPAAILVLYILEILPKVERPGAYLHYLVSHKDGLSEAVTALRQMYLSDDNSENQYYSDA